MKKKTILLNRKLILGKETVAALNPHQQDTVVGGATVNNPGCVGSNHCTVNLDCGPIPITKDATCQQLTKLCA